MSLKKTTQRGHGTMSELNITPLLDLVFVLLVIFIITTPQMMNNLEMTLPSGKPPPPQKDKDKPKTNKIIVDAKGHTSLPGGQKWMNEYKAKFNDDWYTGSTYHLFALLSEAMAKAKSTDPVKVAPALEGLRVKSFNGEVEMRKTDHQLQQGLYISAWQKTDAKYAYSVENTGYTFAPVKAYDAYVASTPTSCQMKRP